MFNYCGLQREKIKLVFNDDEHDKRDVGLFESVLFRLWTLLPDTTARGTEDARIASIINESAWANYLLRKELLLLI